MSKRVIVIRHMLGSRSSGAQAMRPRHPPRRGAWQCARDTEVSNCEGINYMPLWTIAILIVSLILPLAPPRALADSGKGVTATTVVKAPAVRCWEVIIAQRKAQPDTRKIISHDGDRTVMKENYPNLPIIGDAYLEYEEIATPYTTLAAHLVESDKFKAFESKWTLHPSVDGKSTTISLYTYINTGLWVPFAQQLTNRSTRQDISDRLALIKRLAEGAH